MWFSLSMPLSYLKVGLTSKCFTSIINNSILKENTIHFKKQS